MANGIKVFIGGSRRLSRLNDDMKRRLNKILDNGFTVIVGDANGADRAVQRYLASNRYEKVIVFCMAGECRNNVGQWTTREVVTTPGVRRNFAYYAAKDRAMAHEADYGLMLWDGKSRGTLTNIEDLVRQRKPVVVYLAPEKSFVTVRDPDELARFVDQSRLPLLHHSVSRPRLRPSA